MNVTTAPNASTTGPNATSTVTGSVFANNGTTATAATTHQMLKTFLILLIFVIIMTELAGISDNIADGILAFMLVLLVLQGLTHGAALAGFAEHLTLTPKGTANA
jgi:hypothetical protein